MKDHIPTKILANGALRYGVYDDAGTLLRHEYIKPEDEPTEEGDPLCKATLLPDDVVSAVEAALGASLGSNPQIKDALNAFAHNPVKIGTVANLPVFTGPTGSVGTKTATDALSTLIAAMSAITPDLADLIPFRDVSGATAGYATLNTILNLLPDKVKLEYGSFSGSGSGWSINTVGTPKALFLVSNEHLYSPAIEGCSSISSLSGSGSSLVNSDVSWYSNSVSLGITINSRTYWLAITI